METTAKKKIMEQVQRLEKAASDEARVFQAEFDAVEGVDALRNGSQLSDHRPTAAALGK